MAHSCLCCGERRKAGRLELDITNFKSAWTQSVTRGSGWLSHSESKSLATSHTGSATHPLPRVVLTVSNSKVISLRQSHPGLTNITLFDHFAHRDYDFSFAYIRIASMGHQHVVQHQNVAAHPRKTRAIAPVKFADFGHD